MAVVALGTSCFLRQEWVARLRGMRSGSVLEREVGGFVERLTQEPGDAPEVRVQKRLAVIAGLAEAPAGLVWGLIYLGCGEWRAALVPLAFPVLVGLNVAVFRVAGSYRLFLRTQLLATLLLPFLLMLALGGFVSSSAVVIWSLVTPLGALVYASRREAAVWFVLFLGVVMLGGLLDPLVRSPNGVPASVKTALFVLNIWGPSSVAFLLLRYFVGQLNAEQEKSESLLLNVLPREVAQALKNGRQSAPERREGVSVLFADVVGSTVLTAALPPEQMVGLLNGVFSRFDQLAEKYGVEKISTSGDNYMVAAGVPQARADHAQILAAMAVEMCDYVESRPPGEAAIRFRFGINSGSVVAGVIGQKKFHYDLWGDAVNRASRMESHGEPGRIHISEATYELIKGEFECVPRGTVEIKGIGPVRTWWLQRRKAEGERAREVVGRA